MMKHLFTVILETSTCFMCFISDIAIGSPFSDRVVLLKTIPVMELQSQLTLTPRDLSIGALDCYFDSVPSPCFRLAVCVKLIPSFFEITEIGNEYINIFCKFLISSKLTFCKFLKSYILFFQQMSN